jgi:predicted transposase/invertase (TIGR01784 family)
MEENIFQKVLNVMEIAKLNREERAAYEHSLQNYRDLQNVKDTYFQEGKEQGILEGEKKGKILGKIEVANNARKQGLPMDVIVAITQLSEEELRKIF